MEHFKLFFACSFPLDTCNYESNSNHAYLHNSGIKDGQDSRANIHHAISILDVLDFDSTILLSFCDNIRLVYQCPRDSEN